MKNLLRKLFFWDAPAQGAFFGLTLLAVLPRLLITLSYAACLPLFLRGGLQQSFALYSVPVILGAILLYALAVFVHFATCAKSRPWTKALVTAVCTCAALMLAFWGVAPKEFYGRFWWVVPLALIAVGIVYDNYPHISIRDWLYAVIPLLLGSATLFYVLKLNAFALAWPFLEQHARLGWLDSTKASPCLMWTLTICAIILLPISYLLLGRIIAKRGGIPYRALFGKGVAMLWCLFALLYLTSAGLALHAMHDYGKAKKELDAFWGISVTPGHLEELYQKSGRVDQAFWNELSSLHPEEFSSFFKQYEGISLITGYINATLPPDIYEQWKTAFAESPARQRAAEMLDAPLPLPVRKLDVIGNDNSFNRALSLCRGLTRIELWSVRLAMEANDISSAQKALQRIDNISDFLQHDYSMLSGLLRGAIEGMRSIALSRILESGLADEQWLLEQDALLLEKENSISPEQKRMIQGDAAITLNTMEYSASASSRSLFLFLPEAWLLLGREGAALARGYCISDFADYPEKPAGIFAAMLSPGLRSIGTNSIPKWIATLRISRGMIAAELARLKTGHYPESPENLPIDPFSGKPLKYAIGKVEISEEHLKQNDDDESSTANSSLIIQSLPEVQKQLGLSAEQLAELLPEVQKQLGLSAEQLAEFMRPQEYRFETEHRTIEAVQIWSVGLNGIDNGGIRKPGASGDDIRFIIPIQPNSQDK